MIFRVSGNVGDASRPLPTLSRCRIDGVNGGVYFGHGAAALTSHFGPILVGETTVGFCVKAPLPRA